jgi:hypothetical protein
MKATSGSHKLEFCEIVICACVSKSGRSGKLSWVVWEEVGNVPLAGAGRLLRDRKRQLVGLRRLSGGTVLRPEETSNKACSNRGTRERSRGSNFRMWDTRMASTSGEVLGKRACSSLGLDFSCSDAPEDEVAIDSKPAFENREREK